MHDALVAKAFFHTTKLDANSGLAFAEQANRVWVTHYGVSPHYNICYLNEQLVICSLAVTSRHCFSSLGGNVSMASVHIWFELCRLRAGLTSYHPRRHLQLLYRIVYSVVRPFGRLVLRGVLFTSIYLNVG